MVLEIYLGPMYAGKTTKMIEMYNKNESSRKVAIDFNIDDSSNEIIQIKTLYNHNQNHLEGVYNTKDLLYFMENCEEMNNVQYIYINECQFFSHLKTFVFICLKRNINVYLYGLDADYKQDLFGETALLIPYCNYIEKIIGTCSMCLEKKSIVSHRLTKERQVYLPNSDSYVPLCLSCYLNQN